MKALDDSYVTLGKNHDNLTSMVSQVIGGTTLAFVIKTYLLKVQCTRKI